MPGHDAQGELLKAEVLAERGPLQHLGTQSSASSGMAGLVTADSGTFDIATPAGQSGMLPPGPASAAVAEQILVTNDAPPAADAAHVEGGAVVLTSGAPTALHATAAASASTGPTTNVVATTLGCFGAGCTPAATNSTGGLSFSGGSINATSSSNGTLGVGGVASNNFGLLSLSGTPASYTGTSFSLQVNFTSPTTTSATFGVLLLGSVSGENSGGVQVSFTNPTQSFSFAGGTFSLTLNSVAISGSASNSPITGSISLDIVAPLAPPILPRDVEVLALETTPTTPGKDINTVLDLSQLTPTDVAAPIDAGVTSGADPSEWDPSAEASTPDACNDASGAASGGGGPAICHSEKK